LTSEIVGTKNHLLKLKKQIGKDGRKILKL